MKYSQDKKFYDSCAKFLTILKNSFPKDNDTEFDTEVIATTLIMLAISAVKSSELNSVEYIDFCLHLWEKHKEGNNHEVQSE